MEVAVGPNGGILVRDAKGGPRGPVLEFSRSDWVAFLGDVTAGVVTQGAQIERH